MQARLPEPGHAPRPRRGAWAGGLPLGLARALPLLVVPPTLGHDDGCDFPTMDPAAPSQGPHPRAARKSCSHRWAPTAQPVKSANLGAKILRPRQAGGPQLPSSPAAPGGPCRPLQAAVVSCPAAAGPDLLVWGWFPPWFCCPFFFLLSVGFSFLFPISTASCPRPVPRRPLLFAPTMDPAARTSCSRVCAPAAQPVEPAACPPASPAVLPLPVPRRPLPVPRRPLLLALWSWNFFFPPAPRCRRPPPPFSPRTNGVPCPLPRSPTDPQAR